MGDYKHIPRVASFVVSGTGKARVFRPVNERARKLTHKLGKRTRLSVTDLRGVKGYYKLRHYVNGELKTIKL
jgi:hypothetical protein